MTENEYSLPRRHEGDDQGVSLIGFASLVLAHRRVLVILPTLAFIAAFTFGIMRVQEYRTTSTFLPQMATQATGTGVRGIAAQFGVGGTRVGESPEFYATLVTSMTLLREAAAATYQLSDGRQGLLSELYGLDVEGQEAVEASLELLQERVRVDTEAATGLVIVTTIARWPSLAVAVNDTLLQRLNSFNLRRRQSVAAAERLFTETRLAAVQSELEAAEGLLQEFLDQNRQYTASPQLLFEAGRLQRRVDLHQQVYISLAGTHEQARLDEVRNTPLVTVVERPGALILQAGFSAPLLGVIAFIVVATLVGAFVLFWEWAVREAALNPEAYAELRSLWARTTAGWIRRD